MLTVTELKLNQSLLNEIDWKMTPEKSSLNVS